MKPLIPLVLLVFSFAQVSLAQQTDELDSKLTGQWSLTSVKFGGPVDINKDGKKSDDAINEYSACDKDFQLELMADKTARIYKEQPGDCKETEQRYTWSVVKKMIRNARYENGKRIVTETPGFILRLRSTTGDEGRQFLITETEKRSLSVKAELRDGTDSTSEAIMKFKKKKK